MRYCSIVTLICIVLATLPACSQRKLAVTMPSTRHAKNAYQSGAPDTLSEYIRTILRISQENTVAANDAVRQLHERRPELAALARHIGEDAGDVNSRRLLAAAYMEEGLLLHAFQLYQEVRTLVPNDPNVELATATIWYEWRDYPLARQHAVRATVLDPQSAKGLELVGKVCLRQDDYDGAISAFLSALQIDPQNARLLANVGYAFVLRGQLKQAHIYLDRAVQFDPSMIVARNNLGVVLAHLDDREGALRNFMAGNKPAVAYNNLGAVYLAQRRWREARDAFRQAVTLDRDYSKARANLAEAQSHLPLPTVIDLPPLDPAPVLSTDPQSSSRPRLALENTKSPKNERVANKQKVVVEPETRPSAQRASRLWAAYRSGLTSYRSKKYRQAIDLFQWILNANPTSALASHCEYWLGESHFALGSYGAAVTSFKRVLTYDNSTKKRDARVMLKKASVRFKQHERGQLALSR